MIIVIDLTPKQRSILLEAGLRGQGNLDELVFGIYTSRFAIEYSPKPDTPEYFYRRWIFDKDCLPWLKENKLIDYDVFEWFYKLTEIGKLHIKETQAYCL